MLPPTMDRPPVSRVERQFPPHHEQAPNCKSFRPNSDVANVEQKSKLAGGTRVLCRLWDRFVDDTDIAWETDVDRRGMLITSLAARIPANFASA
jgi:hypothetical protein